MKLLQYKCMSLSHLKCCNQTFIFFYKLYFYFLFKYLDFILNFIFTFTFILKYIFFISNFVFFLNNSNNENNRQII